MDREDAFHSSLNSMAAAPEVSSYCCCECKTTFLRINCASEPDDFVTQLDAYSAGCLQQYDTNNQVHPASDFLGMSTDGENCPAPRNEQFRRLAACTASVAGSSTAFLAALGVVVAWAATGPIFHFCDTWQLVINTGTTIVTFLMVFLIQNSQNRDGVAIQLKLDELIRALAKARNQLIDLEHMSDEELKRLRISAHSQRS